MFCSLISKFSPKLYKLIKNLFFYRLLKFSPNFINVSNNFCKIFSNFLQFFKLSKNLRKLSLIYYNFCWIFFLKFAKLFKCYIILNLFSSWSKFYKYPCLKFCIRFQMTKLLINLHRQNYTEFYFRTFSCFNKILNSW